MRIIRHLDFKKMKINIKMTVVYLLKIEIHVSKNSLSNTSRSQHPLIPKLEENQRVFHAQKKWFGMMLWLTIS